MNLLIVEDNEGLASSLTEYLESCGHTVRMVDTAAVAVCVGSTHRYHAIMVDTDLANRQGVQLLKRFRKRPYLGKLIALASPSTLPSQYRPEQIGLAAIVEKPFHLARINSVLQDVCHPRDRVLQVQEITLNPNTFQAHVNNQPLLLNIQQLQLLKLFLQNPGRLLTEDFLVHHLWPHCNELPLAPIIRNHLLVLAQVLRNAGSALCIVAVTHIGYRLQGLASS